MAHLRLAWVLSGRGWADCIVSDHQAEAEVTASYITAAPEDLLTAVTRLTVGETECRAQFEAPRRSRRSSLCALPRPHSSAES